MGVDYLRSWLIERVAKDLRIPPTRIDPNTDLSSQGIDSLLAVALVVDLEEMLGRELPPTLLWERPTINALVETLTGGVALSAAQ